MKKPLILIITCFTVLWLTACSIADWRLVHRIDVQQGNVISQDALNQLTPGMTRRQVQFVMGSPMVADVFHQDRWDYIFLMQPGNGEVSREHVTLFFEDDTLARISGTMRPQQPAGDVSPAEEQVTLVVPPAERVSPGLLNRLWHWITFRDIDKDGLN
jgi:outer membrane protein assembly factor BamE